jgi:L-asparaginase II
MMCEPVMEVTRGPLVESLHRGAIAVVDATGRLRARVGDPHWVTFMRSSAKPLQVVPLLERGVADRFGFRPEELAVMAGSHNGEPHQTAAVLSSLAKIGLDEGALQCGVHEPFDRETRLYLRASGRAASAIHNNCSGKHTAMLALAVAQGAAVDGYTHPDHPVQQAIREAVADLAGVPPGELAVGVDGCGVPVFGLPLAAAALAFARLVDPPATWPAARQQACRRIVQAMQSHPEMVAGRGRLCTYLIRAGNGTLVAKSGAEGFYAVGAKVGGSAGLGVAIKIEDGNRERARDPVVLETLRQLGLLDPDASPALQRYRGGPIRNHRGDVVGHLRPCFRLVQV